MKKYIVKLVHQKSAVFYVKKLDKEYSQDEDTRTKNINEALRFDSYEIAWLVGLVYARFSMWSFQAIVEEVVA